MPSLAALDGLDSSFSSFYVCTAARKFLFFLDPLRVGRVRIRDVLSCSFLDDLLEVRKSNLFFCLGKLANRMEVTARQK